MGMDYKGSWLATASGGMWSIENPTASQVHLTDLAAGLSRTCRYAGQLSDAAEFYSVAEHSVIMTSWAHQQGLIRTRSDALHYLLHDGSEAYFGDMPTPLKALIPAFRELEDRSQTVIYAAFGLGPDRVSRQKPELKRVDTRIRLDEREVMISEPALTAGRDALWRTDPGLEPLGVRPFLLDPRGARELYLSAFAWALTALPVDLPQTRTLLEAKDQLRAVRPELPDFSHVTQERSCDTVFSPC